MRPPESLTSTVTGLHRPTKATSSSNVEPLGTGEA